ncbi:hypothetical protein JOM56_007668 [Amanita muscaria]
MFGGRPRGSDSVDFFILKGFLLSFTSSVFDGMFSLNQGGIQESEDTIRPPYPYLPLRNQAGFMPSRIHRDRYAVAEAEQKLRIMFAASTTCGAEPLRAFAIAVHFGWHKEAEDAARITLAKRRETLGHCDELRLISATDYVDLWDWRYMCQKAVNEVCPGERVYSQASLASTLSSPTIATIREAVLEQSRKKKCPQEIVVDNGIIANIFERLGFENISGFKEILDACHMIAAKIDDAVYKTPNEVAKHKS